MRCECAEPDCPEHAGKFGHRRAAAVVRNVGGFEVAYCRGCARFYDGEARSNPGGTIKVRLNVTDRALRYRAQRRPPPGRRVCVFCGSRRNIEIGHVDGHEERTGPENLVWTCRSCNVTVANRMRRAGIGRLTHQYNPSTDEGARNLGQWMAAVMSMKGETDQMKVADAVRLIRATPPARRSRFAEEIYAKRRRRAASYSEVPF